SSPCGGNDVAQFAVTVIDVTANFSASVLTGEAPLEVDFMNTSSGVALSYVWDFGNGLSSTEIHSASLFTELGNYTITLTATDGRCLDNHSISIIVFGKSSIVIPNVFTPNGDGQNDFFTVDGLNLESVEGEIFNRWGNKMFSWNNINGQWDGKTLSGSDAPDGTYFYMIRAEGIDGEEYFKKGGVSLIR
ncbi:MAG: gliding motility-associated C-terminal domain-containing protein, partial [Vicingaceae bacterium]